MNIEGEPNVSNSLNLPGGLETTSQVKRVVASIETIVNNNMKEEANQSSKNAQKQLVLIDLATTGAGEMLPGHLDSPNQTQVLRFLWAFTVQCTNYFKWRLVLKKEIYEEIRKHVIERPFLCETDRQWQPEISCNDLPDIAQDGSRLWAYEVFYSHRCLVFILSYANRLSSTFGQFQENSKFYLTIFSMTE